MESKLHFSLAPLYKYLCFSTLLSSSVDIKFVTVLASAPGFASDHDGVKRGWRRVYKMIDR